MIIYLFKHNPYYIHVISMNLSKLYNDPSFEGALGGKQKFYMAVKKLDSKVTMKQIEKFLKTEKTYYLHEPFRKPKYYRKVFTKGINYLWQADLIYLDKYWRINKGYRYICFVIDTLSKKLWGFPLKRKTALQLTQALTPLLTSERPQKLQVKLILIIEKFSNKS